jgi:hypothetical protein
VGNRISYACATGSGCGNTSVRAARVEEVVVDALPASVTVKPTQIAEAREAVAELRALEARRDGLGETFASGDMTAEQVRRATDSLSEKIDALRPVVAGQAGELYAVAAASPKVLLADPAYRARWEAHELTATEIEEARAYIRRAFGSITVNPAASKRFDPDRVALQPA